jgi:hypothetical protein
MPSWTQDGETAETRSTEMNTARARRQKRQKPLGQQLQSIRWQRIRELKRYGYMEKRSIWKPISVRGSCGCLQQSIEIAEQKRLAAEKS